MTGWLITGAAGFVGVSVARRLRSRGHEVVLTDLHRNGHDSGWLYGDLCEMDFCRQAVRGRAGVIHIAACADKYAFDSQAAACLGNNILSTLNVGRACLVEGVPYCIVISTDWVYGLSAEEVIAEESPLSLSRAGHPYTASKFLAEEVVRDLLVEGPTSYSILRLGTVYGPRMREACAVFQFLDRIRRDEVISLHDRGRQTRQFVFVDDIADAVEKTLTVQPRNETLNIVGPQVSLLQLIELSEKVAAKKARVHFSEKGTGDHGKLVDGSKAAKLIGWHPATPLEEGLRKSLHWIESVVANKETDDGR